MTDREHTLEKENAALRAALDEIADPIKYMRQRAKDVGGILNGGMAITFSNDPNLLKSIAREALAKLKVQCK